MVLFCSRLLLCTKYLSDQKNNKNVPSSPLYEEKFCKAVMPQRAPFMNLFNLKMTALRSRLSLFQCKHIVIVSGWWEYQLVGDISLGQHYILRIYEIKGLSKAILFLLVSKSWTSHFKSWIEMFLFFLRSMITIICKYQIQMTPHYSVEVICLFTKCSNPWRKTSEMETNS